MFLLEAAPTVAGFPLTQVGSGDAAQLPAYGYWPCWGLPRPWLSGWCAASPWPSAILRPKPSGPAGDLPEFHGFPHFLRKSLRLAEPPRNSGKSFWEQDRIGFLRTNQPPREGGIILDGGRWHLEAVCAAKSLPAERRRHERITGATVKFFCK